MCEGGVGGRAGCEWRKRRGVRAGGVGLEKGKGCEGKVKWGWKEGVGLEEGRGRTTRINLKI